MWQKMLQVGSGGSTQTPTAYYTPLTLSSSWLRADLPFEPTKVIIACYSSVGYYYAEWDNGTQKLIVWKNGSTYFDTTSSWQGDYQINVTGKQVALKRGVDGFYDFVLFATCE